MFFRSATIYRLAANIPNLEAMLSRMAFEPCKPSEPQSRGFIPPRCKEGGALVESVGKNKLIALMTETKVIPSDALDRAVQERAKTIADEQGYPPGRKQMKEIKERVVEELLPRAMTKRNTTFAWIDEENGFLVVDAAVSTKSESIIEALRRCLDEFPLKALRTQVSPQSAMADWLAGGEAPDGFTIDRDCELKANGEEKAVVAYKHHPLGDEVGDEIKSHLSGGKLPTKLAMTFGERVSFVLTEQGTLKRLAFLDILREEAEKNATSADEKFDADFAIMAGEMSRLIIAINDALGGLAEDGDEK